MAVPDASAARIPGDPDADRHWLTAAIELSRLCPVSDSAFSVGAVLVSPGGEPIATGYSREASDKDHAEEVALARAAGAALSVATIYSSLEPCLHRSIKAGVLLGADRGLWPAQGRDRLARAARLRPERRRGLAD